MSERVGVQWRWGKAGGEGKGETGTSTQGRVQHSKGCLPPCLPSCLDPTKNLQLPHPTPLPTSFCPQGVSAYAPLEEDFPTNTLQNSAFNMFDASAGGAACLKWGPAQWPQGKGMVVVDTVVALFLMAISSLGSIFG